MVRPRHTCTVHPPHSPGLRHHLRRVAPGRGGQRIRIVLLGPFLVQRPGQPLRRAPGIHEHQRGAVLHHLSVDRALHVRPHAFLLRQCRFLIHPARHTRPRPGLGAAAHPFADEAGAKQCLVYRFFCFFF